jgi:hypothetical protein
MNRALNRVNVGVDGFILLFGYDANVVPLAAGAFERLSAAQRYPFAIGQLDITTDKRAAAFDNVLRACRQAPRQSECSIHLVTPAILALGFIKRHSLSGIWPDCSYPQPCELMVYSP